MVHVQDTDELYLCIFCTSSLISMHVLCQNYFSVRFFYFIVFITYEDTVNSGVEHFHLILFIYPQVLLINKGTTYDLSFVQFYSDSCSFCLYSRGLY